MGRKAKRNIVLENTIMSTGSFLLLASEYADSDYRAFPVMGERRSPLFLEYPLNGLEGLVLVVEGYEPRCRFASAFGFAIMVLHDSEFLDDAI